MAFPQTEGEMISRGYEKLNDSTCRDTQCKADITWWETPKGKKIPMDKGTATAHWATCVAAESFRKEHE